MKKRLDELAIEMFGEFGFSTCTEFEQECIMNAYKSEL